MSMGPCKGTYLEAGSLYSLPSHRNSRPHTLCGLPAAEDVLAPTQHITISPGRPGGVFLSPQSCPSW